MPHLEAGLILTDAQDTCATFSSWIHSDRRSEYIQYLQLEAVFILIDVQNTCAKFKSWTHSDRRSEYKQYAKLGGCIHADRRSEYMCQI